MKKALLTLTTIAFTLLASRADNVLSDSFGYPDGPIVGAVGSPWANNTGTANTMLASNFSLEVSSSRTEDIVAPLSRVLTNTTDVAAYAGFTVRFLTLPNTNGNYFAHFTAEGGLNNHRGRVWASITNATPPGKFRLGIANTTGGSPSSALWGSDLDTNVTYKVVTRVNLNTGASTLWIDPINETDPSVTDTSPLGAQGISHWGFRQSNSGGVAGVARVDNLRVGSTFEDVAGTNAPPTISAISPVNIPANSSSGPIAITVSDLETPVAALTLSATSTNTTLLPTNNIVFSGSGSSRTVTITPIAGQEGTSLVAVTVADASGATATRSFLVTVGAPSISNIGNQVTPTNVPLAGVAFTIGDAETPGSLTVTATSTNTTLLPNGSILISGTGANRTLTLTPSTDQAGITLVTVTVSDGNQTASDSFVLTVFPKLGLLINEPFTYPDGTQIGNFTTDWIRHSGTIGQTLVNGGKVFLYSTNTEDFNREFFPFAFEVNSGVILYASFEVNFSQLPSAAGGYFTHYKDVTDSGFRGRVFASAQGAAAGQFRLGVTSAAAGVGTNTLHPTLLTTNQNYTVVTRYNVGTGEMSVWINPTSENSVHANSTDFSGTLPAYSFALRQDSGIGFFTVDDLKVGTQFTDVATVIPSYALRIFRSGADVIVAWPTAASAFTLQSATSLTLSNWQDIGQSPVVVGSENFFTNTAPTAPSAFFRLKN